MTKYLQRRHRPGINSLGRGSVGAILWCAALAVGAVISAEAQPVNGARANAGRPPAINAAPPSVNGTFRAASVGPAPANAGQFGFTSPQYFATEFESLQSFFSQPDVPGRLESRAPRGAVITVNRTGGADGVVHVFFQTVDPPDPDALTAIPDVGDPMVPFDYTPIVFGELVFDHLQTSTNFIVPVWSNGTNDLDKQLRLRLIAVEADGEEEAQNPGLIAPTLGFNEAILNILEASGGLQQGTNFSIERFSYVIDESPPGSPRGASNNVVIDVIHPSGTGGSVDFEVVRFPQNIGLFPWISAGSDYAVADDSRSYPATPASGGGLFTVTDLPDYTSSRQTLQFGQGQRRRSVTITITNDDQVEFNEDILVRLRGIGGQPPLGANPNANLTILFDDQPAGALDREWNPDEVRTTTPRFNRSPGANGIVRALVVQPSQKTVIAGDFTAYNSFSRLGIARINSDGSNDDTFTPGTGADGYVAALAVYPAAGLPSDGKLVVGGAFTSFNNIQRNGIARLNADGTLDTFFSPGVGANGVVRSVAIQSDGKVVIAGEFTSVAGVPRNGVARLNGDGSLDPTFDPGTGADGPVWSVAVWEGVPRKVFVGGEFLNFNGAYRGNVARLNDDGSLDSTFDPGGGTDGPVYTVAPQPDGRLLVGGFFSTLDFSDRNNIGRLLASGGVDASFDPGTGPNDAVYCITLQSDGKPLVGGIFTVFNGTRRLGLTRLSTDGTVDTSFMDTAYNQFAGLVNKFYFESPNYVNGVAVQADGNVMIGGSFQTVGGNWAAEIRNNDISVNKPFNLAWTRQQKRQRSNVARLIGGQTPGPGNFEFVSADNPTDESSGNLSVALRRRDGQLGAASVQGVTQDNLALSGQDYSSAQSSTFWRSPYYVNTPSSIGDNREEFFNVGITDDSAIEGDETFRLQLSQPIGSVTLGGEVIQLGAALGLSRANATIVDNDFNHGVFVFSAPFFFTNENAVSLRATVLRTNGSTGRVTVRYFTRDGTALAGLDYTGVTLGTLTFDSGETSKTIAIPLLNDTLVEADEYFTVTLTNATGGAEIFGGQQNSTITATNIIIDNDRLLGSANFASLSFSTNENAGFARVTLLRLGGSLGELSVSVAATNGSAVGGLDYTPVTNTVTWVDGDVAPKTFLVPLLDDTAVEGNETVNLRIFNPSGFGGVGAISTATLNIVEDDAYGALSFSQPFYDADERGTNVTIVVVRSGGVGGTVSVQYRVFAGPSDNALEGTDFIGSTNTLTLGPGVMATNFDVVIHDNNLTDGEHTASLSLNNVVNASLGAIPTATLRIMDDESLGDLAGSLDTSFSATAGGTNAIYALALQPDGKLLVGGEFRTLNRVSRNRVGRLNPDGTLDRSFNPLSGPNGVVRTMALQPDGRVVIGGFFTTVHGTNRNYLARLLADGSVDAFFNPGGGADNPVYAVALCPDGRIAVGGSFVTINGISRAGIAVLEANGSVSASFNPGTGADGTVLAVAVQPDGKLLIGGDFTTVNGISRPHVARLNVDGSVDVTFDPGTGPNAAVRAITLQADGKILIGGAFSNVNGTGRNGVARLDSNGALDVVFLAGIEGANGNVNAIAMQFDTKIIVVGEFTTFNGVSRNRITRLYRNGKTDPTINFGRGTDDLINTALIQPDRKIVIGGRFSLYDGQPRSYLARLHGGSIAGAGAMEFSTPFYEVTENAGAATITVLRRGGTTGSATVDYRALPGSATDGVDFTSVSGTLAFAEGETAQTFLVPILNDFVGEPTETVALVLTNATAGATNGAIPNATLSILNDDSGVGFSSATYAVNEGVAGGTVAITVLRTGATNGTATVNFTTVSGTAASGQDFFPRNGVLTFAPGETMQSFLVPIVDDALIELSETFSVVLTNLTGGGTLNIATATVTIVDNDFQPGVFTFSAPSYSVSESAGTAAITVLRTNGSTGVVSVEYATIDVTALAGGDYVGQSGTLVFAEGQTNQTITITILDDAMVEGDESFLVQLSNPSGGTAISGATNVTVTILDEEFGPGSVDRSFDPGTGANDLVRSVAVQPDGKVIVGGAFTQFDGVSRNFVARMEPNGSNDLAFDPGVGANALVSSVGSAAGGKVLVAGAFDHVGGAAFNRLARLNSDGTPDLLFSGVSSLNAAVNTMTTQPDGRILLGGAFSLPTRGVNRRQASGAVDNSFNPASGADGAVHALAVQPDGSVLLGGAFSFVAGEAHRSVARLDGSGLLDTAFVTGALTVGSVFAVAVQTDGKVLVGGDFATSAGTNRVRLARLNADGTLDSSFNVGPGANATIYGIGLQSSGQIIVAGDFTRINGTIRSRFARLNTDGSVDTSFDPGRGANNTVYSVVMLPDDNILLGGSFTEVGGAPRSGVARVLGSAVAPAAFAHFAAAGGQFHLTLTVRPQHTYVLEVSHNLASWTPVVTNTALTAEWQFTDSAMMGSTAKFYRLREVTP